MRYLALLVLAFVPIAHADTLSGVLSNIPGSPGETISFDLNVSSSLHTIISAVNGQPFSYFSDVIVGQLLFRDANGSLFSTWNTGDTYQFGVNETMIAFQFGQFSGNGDLYGPPPVFQSGYELKLDASGAHWVFVPEPGVLVLLLCGLLIALPLKLFCLRTTL